MAGAILTQFVSRIIGQYDPLSGKRTLLTIAFAGATYYVAKLNSDFSGGVPLAPQHRTRERGFSDAYRGVSARKPVATRRKRLCEPLDADGKDGA